VDKANTPLPAFYFHCRGEKNLFNGNVVVLWVGVLPGCVFLSFSTPGVLRGLSPFNLVGGFGTNGNPI